VLAGATAGVASGFGAGVGLGLDCMFIAFFSFSFPSGPNKTSIALFWLSFARSCGTAISYPHFDPAKWLPSLFNSQRAYSGAPRIRFVLRARAGNDPRRIAFDALHSYSVTAMGVAILAGLVGFLIMARPKYED